MFRVEQRSARVRVLWMDDGKVNAIGPTFLERFGAAWSEATAHGGGVVLASSGRAFCAGIDLKHVSELDEEGTTGFARDLMAVFDHVRSHERPVVAAIDGAAIAGGAVLALCADVRLCTPRARMGVTEVPVGVPFPEPIARLVTARLPPHEHAPALLEGTLRQGPECVERGWAHRLVDSERVLDAAVGAAETLSAHSPRAFGQAKQLLTRQVDWTFDEKAWAADLVAEDTRAAVRATLERLAKKG